MGFTGSRAESRSTTSRSGCGRESMNGARLVHDELVAHGCELLIADVQKVKGLALLACKTDKSAWTPFHQGADELPDGCPRPVEYVDLAHEPRISAGFAVHRLQ